MAIMDAICEDKGRIKWLLLTVRFLFGIFHDMLYLLVHDVLPLWTFLSWICVPNARKLLEWVARKKLGTEEKPTFESFCPSVVSGFIWITLFATLCGGKTHVRHAHKDRFHFSWHLSANQQIFNFSTKISNGFLRYNLLWLFAWRISLPSPNSVVSPIASLTSWRVSSSLNSRRQSKVTVFSCCVQRTIAHGVRHLIRLYLNHQNTCFDEYHCPDLSHGAGRTFHKSMKLL